MTGAVFLLQRRSEMPDLPRWVCLLVRWGIGDRSAIDDRDASHGDLAL